MKSCPGPDRFSHMGQMLESYKRDKSRVKSKKAKNKFQRLPPWPSGFCLLSLKINFSGDLSGLVVRALDSGYRV